MLEIGNVFFKSENFQLEHFKSISSFLIAFSEYPVDKWNEIFNWTNKIFD